MQYHVSSDTKRRALVCVQKVLLGSKQTLDITHVDFAAEKISGEYVQFGQIRSSEPYRANC